MKNKRLTDWMYQPCVFAMRVYEKYHTNKNGKIALALSILFSAAECFADTSVKASQALGYIEYIIVGVGIIMTLIMAVSTGFAFKNDAASAKTQLIGTIMIPVLMAIVIYIFKKVFSSVNISASEDSF